MKTAILLLALALAACSGAPASQGGIVSTNPCADAMLVELVPPARIAAISHYSQDPSASSIDPKLAQRFRTTMGTAEEVIALRPELVLTSSMTPAATRTAYARAGLRTVVLDSPTSIAASEAQVMRLARMVGAEPRGHAMVARIEAAVRDADPQATLHTVRAEPVEARVSAHALRQAQGERGKDAIAGHNPSALLFIAGDLASGSGNLLDELMRRAGLRNAAAEHGLTITGTVPIETIAAHPPDLILSPGDGRKAALRRRVLADTGAHVIEATFPRRLMNCGGPVIVPALQQLAAMRRMVAL